MSSTPEFNETQLAAARAKTWHQDGEAIRTMEAAREWLNGLGVILFAPKPQLATPAGSLVEATLGAANAAPTLAETELARTIMGRLVAEGVALPLNLLGVPGDTPDFLVSAQVFSYVFTLRGDKAWKQAPSTSGATKVSALSLGVYEALTAKGALTASELAGELGREVTETAILRSLVELWSQLRVIPLVQLGEQPTMWELTTRRFTKSIKAGANAGQPTALSALVSLYLAQALAATEDEIETFLSPLTARSRVRDVLHALTGARQLETFVLEGRSLLHIPGELPEFAKAEVAAGEGVEGEGAEAAAVEKPKKIGTGRISKFTAEANPVNELRGKPVRSLTKGREERGPGPVKPSARFGARLDGKTEGERRPFKKAVGGKAGVKAMGGAKPVARKTSFTKPWEDDVKPRVAKPAVQDGFTKFRKPEPEDREPLKPREQAGLPESKRTPAKSSFDWETSAPAKRAYKPREGGTRPFVKKAFGDKSAFGEKKPFGAKKPYAPGFGSRGGSSAEGSERPAFGAKKPWAGKSADGGARSFAKPSFAKPSFGDKKPAFGAKKPWASKSADGPARSFAKPAFGDKKPAFGAKRPYTPRTTEGGERPAFAKRPYTPRTSEGGGSFAKKPYTPRTTEGGERPAFAKRPYTPRTSEGSGSFAKKPYTPRTTEGGERPAFAKRPYTPRAAAPRGDSSVDSGGFAGGRQTAGSDERSIPKRPYKPRAADADQRKFTKAPWSPSESDAPAKTKRSSSKPRFGGRAAGNAGGKPGGFSRGPRGPRTGE